MIFLLDTDVLSQSTKVLENSALRTWRESSDQSQAVISVVSIMELTGGIHLLPFGRKRQSMQRWMDEVIRPAYQNGVLPITDEIATLAGKINAEARRSGHTAGFADVLLAATASVHHLRIVTLNRKHFELLNAEIFSF